MPCTMLPHFSVLILPYAGMDPVPWRMSSTLIPSVFTNRLVFLWSVALVLTRVYVVLRMRYQAKQNDLKDTRECIDNAVVALQVTLSPPRALPACAPAMRCPVLA